MLNGRNISTVIAPVENVLGCGMHWHESTDSDRAAKFRIVRVPTERNSLPSAMCDIIISPSDWTRLRGGWKCFRNVVDKLPICGIISTNGDERHSAIVTFLRFCCRYKCRYLLYLSMWKVEDAHTSVSGAASYLDRRFLQTQIFIRGLTLSPQNLTANFI